MGSFDLVGEVALVWTVMEAVGRDLDLVESRLKVLIRWLKQNFSRVF